MRECEVCGTEFTSPWLNARYCKVGNKGRCKEIAQRRRARDRKLKGQEPQKAKLEPLTPEEEAQIIVPAKFLVRGKIGPSKTLEFSSNYVSQY